MDTNNTVLTPKDIRHLEKTTDASPEEILLVEQRVLAKLPGMPADEWLRKLEDLVRDANTKAAEVRAIMAHARARIQPAASEAEVEKLRSAYAGACDRIDRLLREKDAASEADLPEGWRVVERKTCYALHHGNEVIATLAGPDSEANAAILARMLGTSEADSVIRNPLITAREAGAVPTNDRGMLQAVMNDLDVSWWYCPKCGHGEECKDMDAALMLRDYLAAPPSAPAAESAEPLCHVRPIGHGWTVCPKSHADAVAVVLLGAAATADAQGDMSKPMSEENQRVAQGDERTVHPASIASLEHNALYQRLKAQGDERAALAELVACDNLKKQIASMQVCVMETDDDVQELDTMMSNLARRQPAAWDAARAALSRQPSAAASAALQTIAEFEVEGGDYRSAMNVVRATARAALAAAKPEGGV